MTKIAYLYRKDHPIFQNLLIKLGKGFIYQTVNMYWVAIHEALFRGARTMQMKKDMDSASFGSQSNTEGR